MRGLLVALSAIVAVVCSASTVPPELRWAQTKDKVFITVVNAAQCAQPEFGRDTLTMDCGKNGKARTQAIVRTSGEEREGEEERCPKGRPFRSFSLFLSLE
jgi:hypothetical protein